MFGHATLSRNFNPAILLFVALMTRVDKSARVNVAFVKGRALFCFCFGLSVSSGGPKVFTSSRLSNKGAMSLNQTCRVLICSGHNALQSFK